MSGSKIIPAEKTKGITYAIRDIIVIANETAKTGKEMMYLNIGDPNAYDHVTPPHIVEAVCKAMRDNKNGYCPSSGIPEALDAIVEDAESKGITNVLDAFVTSGASEAIEICLTALLNKGENFLMPTPGYPLYTAVQSKLELEPNPYYLDESNGWQPDIEDIKSKINDKTRAIVVINPNNPTGSVASKEILERIAEIAIENNLLVIADEIYDKLLFSGEKHASIASLSEDLSCVTFSGMSKNYVVPGFRLGWGVASGKKEETAKFIEAVNRILRARVCANHPEQYGAIAALKGEQTHLKKMNETLKRRNDLTVKYLNEIPRTSLVQPKGAFYAFPSVEVEDDFQFVKDLIKATGVVVVPGSGFGQKSGTTHFRAVILPDEETIEKSYKLIGDFLADYK